MLTLQIQDDHALHLVPTQRPEAASHAAEDPEASGEDSSQDLLNEVIGGLSSKSSIRSGLR